MIAALAPLAGALITLMNTLNSRFSAQVGRLVSVLTIHLVGLGALGLILLGRTITRALRLGANPRPAPDPGSGSRVRLPFYAYAGGVVGVGTVFASVYAYGSLGASLAVALGLIGQIVFSLVVDTTGAFGRQIRPLSPRRLPGIAAIAAGAVFMAGGNWRVDLPALLAALFAGVAVGTSSVLNARLGQVRGLFRATAMNYLTGISATLLIVIATAPSGSAVRGAIASVLEAGPLLAMGGGLMGVVSVGMMSFLFARLPAFTASTLSFAGQSLCGLVLDAASGIVNSGKLAGTLLVILGLGLDMALERGAEARR